MTKTDIFDLFEEEEAALDASLDRIDSGTMSQLSTLVDQMVEEQQRIDRLEQKLKEAKARKQKLAVENIPALMSQMGIDKVTTKSGATVTVAPMISASIPADNREQAFAWLRENGFDGIIKNDLILSFGKGEDDVADKVRQRLEAEDLPVEQKTHIHPSTLKAFVRECLEKGTPIDLDLFGAYVVQMAQVKGS
jgi:hypothetical protein